MTIADELSKLAALRSSGILTDDEFATEKARLLGNDPEYVTEDGPPYNDGDPYEEGDPDDPEGDLYRERDLYETQLRGHSGPLLVKTIFQTAALLVAVAGVVLGLVAARNLSDHHESGGTTVAITAGIMVGSLLTAAAFAFFAYVLDLLVNVDLNTRGLRYWDPVEADLPEEVLG